MSTYGFPRTISEHVQLVECAGHTQDIFKPLIIPQIHRLHPDHLIQLRDRMIVTSGVRAGAPARPGLLVVPPSFSPPTTSGQKLGQKLE